MSPPSSFARPRLGRVDHARRAATASVALLLALAPSCGGGGEAAAPTTADTAPSTSAPEPAPEPVCTDEAVAGRRYVLCTAGDAPDQGLIVALHGRGSSADDMREVTGLEHDAAVAGLAVAYPEALDGGWGDDTFTSAARPAGDEDARFLDALVERLREDPRIAGGSIGVVGFSNGASMALRYAADRPDQVRGVVAVAGQLPRDPAVRPSARAPLLAVYGTADPLRAYDTGIPEGPDRRPGEPTPTLSTPETVAAFVALAAGEAVHDAEPEVDRDPGDGTQLRTERWTDRAGTLAELVTIVGGGHTWPVPAGAGGDPDRFGPTSRELDASAVAIDFLVDPDTYGQPAGAGSRPASPR